MDVLPKINAADILHFAKRLQLAISSLCKSERFRGKESWDFVRLTTIWACYTNYDIEKQKVIQEWSVKHLIILCKGPFTQLSPVIQWHRNQ